MAVRRRFLVVMAAHASRMTFEMSKSFMYPFQHLKNFVIAVVPLLFLYLSEKDSGLLPIEQSESTFPSRQVW